MKGMSVLFIATVLSLLGATLISAMAGCTNQPQQPPPKPVFNSHVTIEKTNGDVVNIVVTFPTNQGQNWVKVVSHDEVDALVESLETIIVSLKEARSQIKIEEVQYEGTYQPPEPEVTTPEVEP